MTAALLIVVLAQVAGAEMLTSSGATIEGRPLPQHASPLQARIDAAHPGDRIVVPAGTYAGDLIIDRPLTLAGEGLVILVGSGTGSVVRVRAPGVELAGVEIDGRGGGDLGRDASGIHVAAAGVRIHDCTVRNSLFGIYLRQANDAVVERCRVIGIPGRPPGEIGSGIHLWNTERFTIRDNEIIGTRDGMYIQSSNHGVVQRNRARDLRYGLHYMFSDDNAFEDNTFENGAAGTAIMYSRRIAFRRNRFLRNRGFASVGLLFKECDDVLAEDNLIADNARGVFLEGGYRNVFRRNVIAMSDQAVVLYDSTQETTFEGNAFVANLTPLSLVGRRTNTRFDGNYWSDHLAGDVDGDGIADRPYRLSNVFDHLRGNLMAADLFAGGVAARALAAAESAFPVLDPIPVVDARPLARAPRLQEVPTNVAVATSRNAGGASAPLALVVVAAAVLGAGGRSWARSR